MAKKEHKEQEKKNPKEREDMRHDERKNWQIKKKDSLSVKISKW